MIALRFAHNVYYAQFAVQWGRIIIGRWMLLWGRRAFCRWG